MGSKTIFAGAECTFITTGVGVLTDFDKIDKKLRAGYDAWITEKSAYTRYHVELGKCSESDIGKADYKNLNQPRTYGR